MNRKLFLQSKGLSLVGFFLMAAMSIYLLILTLIEASAIHPPGIVIIGLITVGALFEIYIELKQLLATAQGALAIEQVLLEFLAIIIGALITYLLANQVGIGAVVAASVVGILAHFFYQPHEVAVFTGAFVGMSSELMFLNLYELLIAALIAAIVYVISINIFQGLGGKSGTIALVGTFLASNSLARPFIPEPLPELTVALTIIAFSTLATPITYFLNFGRNLGPIMSSSLVGLLSGLILPSIFPEYGSLYAIIVICAAFIGMTCQRRCKNYVQIIFAGLIMGIIIIYATPLLGGAGGKLGAIAFLAILSVMGYKDIIEAVKIKDH